MAISPQNNEKKRVFYIGKLYGLTGVGVGGGGRHGDGLGHVRCA